uniref:Uncharacterized protein n=1 Tax=Macaca nemestrina TaxID=9545 RepID=A0A2K6DX90_MACNE
MNVFKTQMLPCPSGVQSRPEERDETPILRSKAQSMTVMAFLVARLLVTLATQTGGGRMDTQLMRGQCSATKVVFWPGCLPQPRMHSRLQIRSINKGGQLRPTGCNKQPLTGSLGHSVQNNPPTQWPSSQLQHSAGPNAR